MIPSDSGRAAAFFAAHPHARVIVVVLVALAVLALLIALFVEMREMAAEDERERVRNIIRSEGGGDPTVHDRGWDGGGEYDSNP